MVKEARVFYLLVFAHPVKSHFFAVFNIADESLIRGSCQQRLSPVPLIKQHFLIEGIIV